MKYPKISVVIPAYNEEKFIAKTLASLAQQDYPGVFEVIVVNNASTDNTAAVATAHGARVVDQPKKGLPFARQAGFEAATGEFVASTDADDILPTNWLTRLADQLLAHPEYVAVGGWFKLKSGPLIPRFYVNFLSAPVLLLFFAITKKPILQDQNYLVRKSAFDAVGGYKGLAAMNEDLMLAQRLATVGEVKFFVSPSWSVVQSHRRFNNGFILGVARYCINAISFAFTSKLPIKDFKDIREEKQPVIPLGSPLSLAASVVIIAVAFTTVPTSQVQAKIAPVTKRTQEQFNKVINNTYKPYIMNSTAVKQGQVLYKKVHAATSEAKLSGH